MSPANTERETRRIENLIENHEIFYEASGHLAPNNQHTDLLRLHAVAAAGLVTVDIQTST